MKFKILLAVIAIFIINNEVNGQMQNDQYAFSSTLKQRDSLIIERQNGQKIKLIWPYSKNIKKNVEWEKLLDDFKIDFQKINDNIPDYNFYSITYIQKQNLVVDEITGRETYTVNEKEGMDYVKSNICKLKGNRININIEFNDSKELLDPSLKADIESAIAQVKNKFYISYVSPERHYFSVKSASILPNPKPKLGFFVPMGARLGVLKNQPYIELRPGLGVMIDKRYYIALNWNFMTQYNNEFSRTEYDSYVGLTTATLGAGFGSEVAFKVKSGIVENEDIYFRAGVNYRTRSGIQIGVDYYLRDSDEAYKPERLLFGFNLGIGF